MKNEDTYKIHNTKQQPKPVWTKDEKIKQSQRLIKSIAYLQQDSEHHINKAIFDQLQPLDATSKAIALKHKLKQDNKPKTRMVDIKAAIVHEKFLARYDNPANRLRLNMVGTYENQNAPSINVLPLHVFEKSNYLTKTQKRREEKTRSTMFNTLAQLVTAAPVVLKPKKIDVKALKKRAAAKFYTEQYLQHLIDLDSPLKASYINTQLCATELIQTGSKIKSSYCKNRWCNVCNRIRTANLINGYLGEVQSLNDKYFVTLTFANVSAYYLPPALDFIQLFWRKFYKDFRSKYRRAKGIDKKILRGITKMECTYNAELNNYHPHLHVLIEGKKEAELLLNEWKKYCINGLVKIDDKGQDIKPCDNGTVKELFKYFTKIATNTGGKEIKQYRKKGGELVQYSTKKQAIFIYPIDQIFQAMRGRRVYNTFGIKKLDEDKLILESEEIEGLKKESTCWRWKCGYNWFSERTYEPITKYKPSKIELKIAEKIVLQ